MAKDKWLPERLIQYIISNKDVPYREQWLEKWKQDMSYLSRAVESASPAGKFFQTKPKEINPNRDSPDYGLGEQRIIIDASSEGTVSPSLMHANEFLSIARDWEDGYSIQKREVPLVKGKKSIVGKEAFEIAKNSIRSKGGDIRRKPTKTDPNEVQFYYPFPDEEEMHGSDWIEDPEGGSVLKRFPTPADKRRVTNRIFSAASKKSTETENRIAEETAAKEEAKKQKEEEREKKESEKEEKEQKQKSNRFFAHVLSWLSNIYNKLVQIALGSFRTAVAAEARGVETRTAGVSAPERRGMDLFDRAHGMKEGQTFAAIQEIQKIAGDVTNIDEKAIGTFARVVGEDIKGLVRSGVGEADPQKFMELVLDKYFLAFKEGKNSYGQYIGREQARQNLYLSLQDVAPNLATLFARMADDYSSNYYGDFNSVAEWHNTTETNRTGLLDSAVQYREEQAKALNALSAAIADLKDAFLTGVVSHFRSLIGAINNSRLFMSESNKIQTDLVNRRRNEENKNVLLNQNQLYEASLSETINKYNDFSYTPTKLDLGFLTKKGKQNRLDLIRSFDFTPDVVAELFSGTMESEKLHEITGLSGKELNVYAERAMEIANSLLSSDETAGAFSRLVANKIAVYDINEQNAKKRNVDLVNFTTADQTLAAAAFVELALANRDTVDYKKSAFYNNSIGTRRNIEEGLEKYLMNEEQGDVDFWKYMSSLTGGKLEDFYVSSEYEPEAARNKKLAITRNGIQAVISYLSKDEIEKNRIEYVNIFDSIPERIKKEEERIGAHMTDAQKYAFQKQVLLEEFFTQERVAPIYDKTDLKVNFPFNTHSKGEQYIVTEALENIVQAVDKGIMRLMSDAFARSELKGFSLQEGQRFIGGTTAQGEYVIRIVDDKTGKDIVSPVSLGNLSGYENFSVTVSASDDGSLILKNAGGQ